MVTHLLSKLSQFRENGDFIDVRLKVDESIFPVHRNVLAANSDYFHAMFANGMKESNQEVIELKDESISALSFKIILDSIYRGDVLVCKENVFEVLATASHLQMPIIVRQCCDFLDKEYVQGCIDIQTYLNLLAFANLHGLRDLKEATQSKMASVYKEICEREEFLFHIDDDQFLNLLSRDDLSAPSETFIFKSVMQWIKCKKEERMPFAAKVIGEVRLGLVDTKDVVEELNTEEMKRVPEIQMLMCDKLLHSNMPSASSKFAVEKTRPRSITSVYVAIFPHDLDDKGRQQEEEVEKVSDPNETKYLDVETKSWKPMPSMAKLNNATECIGAEVVRNNLYVAASRDDASVDMYCYNTIRNVWETLLCCQCDFVRVCVCSFNEYIYVFSDRSEPPQRYSLSQNVWQSATELPFLKKLDRCEALLSVTAVSIKSKIYVLHGYYSDDDHDDVLFKSKMSAKPAVVHCFDPKKNEWEKKASTLCPHFESSLIVDNNKLYVAGGKVSVYKSWSGAVYTSGETAPVEVYDEENNSWCVVQQNHIPSNDLNAVELIGGKVYFIINKFPIDSGIRIPPNEVYKISLQEWENLTTIHKAAVLCYLPVNKEMLNTLKAAAKPPLETVNYLI